MKLKAVIAVIASLLGLQYFSAGTASASPGQCGQGYAMGSGGGFCDGAPRADGHWYHCETVFVLGFGGTNCFWVHPVGTDVDPRGWQPD